MSARDLLERAVATGVTILADDGELVLRGDQSAIASLVPDAKAHKAALLDELTRQRLPEDLERRIECVAAFYNFPPDELQLAKDIVAGDIENATTFYRYASARIRGEH